MVVKDRRWMAPSGPRVRCMMRREALTRNCPASRAPVYGQPHLQISNFLCSVKACDEATSTCNISNIWYVSGTMHGRMNSPRDVSLDATRRIFTVYRKPSGSRDSTQKKKGYKWG